MFGNKRGISVVLKAVLALVIFGVFLYIIINGFSGIPNLIKSITKTYTQPNIRSNSYFIADSAGIVDGDALKNSGCIYNAATYTYNGCTPGVILELSVNLHNTGPRTTDLYPYPRIGFNCNSGSDKCEWDYWLKGQRPCTIPAGQTTACSTVNTYTFDRSGIYRIYPGGLCSKDECVDPNQPLGGDTQAYNPRSFITIEVK